MYMSLDCGGRENANFTVRATGKFKPRTVCVEKCVKVTSTRSQQTESVYYSKTQHI